MGEFPQGESTAGTQDGGEEDGESAPGDLGEFPQGESTAGAQDGTEADDGEGEGEPGFVSGDYGAGDDDALPDLIDDEPTLEEALESLEEAMGEAGGSPAGGDPAEGGQAAGTPPAGDPSTAGGSGDSAAQGEVAGDPSASGTEAAGSQASAGGTGPLTPAEQAAILDGKLERGTDVFDAMILGKQAEQRQAAREHIPGAGEPADQADTGSGGAGGDNEEGVADAGIYSTGGGIGGVSRPGSSTVIPSNTAKYPPPANIPSGNDDDVVARQLREAAMREPDPEIREKLWDEYRKYKGMD